LWEYPPALKTRLKFIPKSVKIPLEIKLSPIQQLPDNEFSILGISELPLPDTNFLFWSPATAWNQGPQ
jgi:hypothetical protein